MAAPFFSYLNYKDSNYSQNDGYIENIQVTSDTGNLLSISWVGPNGFTSGPSSVPPPDLTNLEPGIYTGTVVDTVTLETDTINITIAELPEVILNAVFDDSCIDTVNCDCVLDVLGFTHNSTTFKYDLYKNGVLVDTYYGSTGSEAHQFTGLCDGEYFLLATELDINVYTFENLGGCPPGDLTYDENSDPNTIVDNWDRFAFFANASPILTPNNTLPSGLQPDGTITNAPGTTFERDAAYGGVGAIPWDKGNHNIPMDEGDDLGPDNVGFQSGIYAHGDFYYNTAINKYLIALGTAGYGGSNPSSIRWVTFNPTEDNSLGNPTAAKVLTSASQWSVQPLTPTQATVDGSGNVVLAQVKNAAFPEMIQCAFNSSYINGFYSGCNFSDYVHEVTIGSTDGDNDEIGIVMAAYKDVDGIWGPADVTHTIQLLMSTSGGGNIRVALDFGSNAYGLDYLAVPGNLIVRDASFPTGGWSSVGNIRIKIEKIGTLFNIYRTDPFGAGDVGNPRPYFLVYSFDLLDPNTWHVDFRTEAIASGQTDILEKFTDKIKIGYSTASQPAAQFFDIAFSGTVDNTTRDTLDELGADDEFLAAMPCGCPQGFVYNAKTDECDIEIQESIICNPTTYTVEPVNVNPQYTAQGAYFYEDASNRPLPLTRSQLIVGGTTQGDRVVRDGNGNILAVERIIQNNVWGNSFGYNPAIVTFGGPNSIDTGTPVPNAANLAQVAANGLSPNTGWISPWVGRMNAIGVWTNSTSGNTALPLNEWVGFTACVEVPTTKKYTIGISGDNWFRFKVDGQLYFDFSLSGTDGYQRWHVVELELTAGQHIVEFEGLNTPSNTGGANPAALAAEIYDASSATLQTITTVEELEPLIVWSTADLIGEPFDSGEESGCHCPDGFTLSACDGELKCVRYESVPFIKCNCYRATNCENTDDFFLFTIDSSLPALDVNLIYKFDDPAGRANPDACYIIEESDECDVAVANLSVAETFADCDTCSGTCYSLTSCTDPADILYIDGLGAPELAQYIGQVISIFNSETEILSCVTVATLPCNQTTDPLPSIPDNITIQEEFCDCEECLPKPIEVPDLEINNRTVKPGYDTPGCSPEYVEKISCDYSEALYQEVISKRYGIEFCCSKDLNSLDIKKQLMDFKMITDPDACQEIATDCCPPCNLELELNAIPTTECQAPASIQPFIFVPEVGPSPDCRNVRMSRTKSEICDEVTFTGFNCAGEPITVVLNADNPNQTVCVDVALPWSVSPAGCIQAGVISEGCS